MCQQIASQKVLELAIRYAGRINRMALAKKLENVVETKESEYENEETETQEDMFKDDNADIIEDDEPPLFTLTPKAPAVEIKPLALSQTLGRRSNPFKKRSSTPTSKGKFYVYYFKWFARTSVNLGVHTKTIFYRSFRFRDST